MDHFEIGDWITIHGPFGEWSGIVCALDLPNDWMEVTLPNGTAIGVPVSDYVEGNAQPRRVM